MTYFSKIPIHFNITQHEKSISCAWFDWRAANQPPISNSNTRIAQNDVAEIRRGLLTGGIVPRGIRRLGIRPPVPVVDGGVDVVVVVVIATAATTTCPDDDDDYYYDADVDILRA
jgi:hypothetical protein